MTELQHPDKTPCRFLSIQAQQLVDTIPLLPKSTVPGQSSAEVNDLMKRAHDDFLLHARSCQDCADVIAISGIMSVT
jgi:hypothetical protein